MGLRGCKISGGRGQLDKGLEWVVPWEGARAYGAGAWEGTKTWEYKSLDGGRDLGVGGNSLTWT